MQCHFSKFRRLHLSQSDAACLCLQDQHTYPRSSSTLSSWQVFLHAQMRTLKSASHLVLQFRSGLAATLPS